MLLKVITIKGSHKEQNSSPCANPWVMKFWSFITTKSNNCSMVFKKYTSISIYWTVSKDLTYRLEPKIWIPTHNLRSQLTTGFHSQHQKSFYKSPVFCLSFNMAINLAERRGTKRKTFNKSLVNIYKSIIIFSTNAESQV